MSDILDRLKLARTATGCYQSMGCKFEQLIDDAADEIERLRTELSELLAEAPSPTGLGNPEAPKPNDKYTFVFPDASMTKIRYIFVDGEMVYENLEPEQ